MPLALENARHPQRTDSRCCHGDGRGLDIGVIDIGDGECAIDNGGAIAFGIGGAASV